jgi:hypothetical protein
VRDVVLSLGADLVFDGKPVLPVDAVAEAFSIGVSHAVIIGVDALLADRTDCNRWCWLDVRSCFGRKGDA